MTYIDPLQDIMNYYSWVFSAYVFAAVIILLNTIRTVLLYLQKRTSTADTKPFGIFDLLTSTLCLAIQCSGMLFLGILADNGAPGWNNWNIPLWLLLLFSGVLVLLQLVLQAKTPKSK